MNQKGFTIPELTLVMGIIAVLTGITTINIVSSQHKASIIGATTTLIADLKNQQAKAMVGVTEGRPTADVYGVHFNSTSYVLFHSITFNSSDPANSIFNLDSNLQFTNITYPNANIIFSQGTGEISGFVNGSNTITVASTLGSEQKTITINRYGVVTGVQ